MAFMRRSREARSASVSGVSSLRRGRNRIASHTDVVGRSRVGDLKKKASSFANSLK
jgi:hypothetical protein